LGLFGSVKKHFIVQLIGVVLLEKSCKIYIKKVKNSKVIHRAKKTFDLESKEKLSSEVITYLLELQEEHEQSYVALFLNTLGQGAIAGCNTGAYEKFGVDKKSVKSICLDDNFTAYASLIDINWVDKIFKKVGLDFVFSPFLVLNTLSKKDYSEDEVKLHILNTDNGLTMMIKKGKKLLYGAFFNIAKEEDLLHEDFESSSFGSIDSLEEELFEEFELDDDTLMNELGDGMDFDEVETTSSQLSDIDSRLVKYLDASLKEFYHSELYDSEFISAVKIYDDAGMHEDVIKHIENELLLDTSAENINILDVVIEIAEEEVMGNA
jgi:hypothetical protein